MIRSLAALILSLFLPVSSSAAESHFAVARIHTPVLNTPDFPAVFGGKDGNTLQEDECGQLGSLEFVALPGTVFTMEAELRQGSQKIYRVKTADYPYPAKSGYFVDARFVTLQADRPPERTAVLPAKDDIIAALRKRAGSRYVWGGNNAEGIAELLLWYPPAINSTLSDAELNLWTLAGVDCSGLLYEATCGYTPRNTSALLHFGKSVSVAGKSLPEITASLQPLDLLVWPGHVLIVLDGNTLIESRLVCHEPEKGVRIRPIAEALNDIMKKRKPADGVKNGRSEFVVRRWYGVSQ